MPEVRRSLRNVWYDTAGSPLLYPTASISSAALACVDHRKLLYASDYPLLLYPRQQTEPDFRPFLAEIERLELSPDVRADVMGDNMARLLGLLPALPAEDRQRVARPSLVLTDVDPRLHPAIDPMMATSAVAAVWPETQVVFARHGIPWQDSPVPYWEPINQAAAAQGYDRDAQRRLIEELNEAISHREHRGL
jgi:predicted TIM-barrel fold metal-dependent hydrolase